MSREIAERAFEDAIECALLFFVRSGPGTVKLPSDSAREFIRTRCPGFGG